MGDLIRKAEDYENEIADLHNRLDIAEYDKERLREEITILEAENKEELTNEKAIAFLQDNGWLVEHDRIMTSGIENKGDLISRQAVENITWEEPSYSDPLNVLTEVREKVRALPSVENKGEWIPVSERLPEEDTKVYLACCDDGYVTSIMYDSGKWLINDTNIIAWMPLPEPYKADMRGE